VGLFLKHKHLLWMLSRRRSMRWGGNDQMLKYSIRIKVLDQGG
jgi:hypothetical protein